MDREQYHRRSVRREGYDYRDGGMYYVTICTNNRELMFGEIRNGIMGLNEWGCIVADELQKTSILRPYVALDTWIIMPIHVHVILYLEDPMYLQKTSRDGRGVARYAPTTSAPTDENNHIIGPAAGSLGAIIRSFKSAVTKHINDLRDAPGDPVWQRNFYERIIRKPDELDRIRSYILQNPRNWLTDDEYANE
jgi:putative transposase